MVPEVQAMCRAFLKDAEEIVRPYGVSILVTQTYRTAAEQNALYAMGRTSAGRIVTNSPAGYSWHEYGRAFDIGFLIGQRLTYTIKDQPGIWEMLGDLGEKHGLEWGGRWKKPDMPHFQNIAGITLAQARAQGYTPAAPKA